MAVTMDEQAVAQLLEEVSLRFEKHGLDALTDEEASVLLASVAHDSIRAGGFQRYFVAGISDVAEVARAFRRLRLTDAANACAQVRAAVYPEGRPSEKEARDSLLEAVDWSRYSAQQRLITELPPEALDEAIRRYIAGRPLAFGLPEAP